MLLEDQKKLPSKIRKFHPSILIMYNLLVTFSYLISDFVILRRTNLWCFSVVFQNSRSITLSTFLLT